MLAKRRPMRSAFSLMEMMLALAIAMVLLLALYLTLNTQIVHLRAGRDVVAEGALARNLLMLIAADIRGQIATRDPRSLPELGTSTTQTDPMNMPATTEPPPVFNLGVFGDDKSLVLSGVRVQKPRLVVAGKTDMPVDYATNDLRYIGYWIATDGEKSGLARFETKHATAKEIDQQLIELPEQSKYIIAKEVKSIVFEYYDGVAWQPSWDGLLPAEGLDDGTTVGPPAAIKVTITLRPLDTLGLPVNETLEGRSYSHIVALPAGNNYPLQAK